MVSNIAANTDIDWVRLQDMAGHMLDAAKESDWEKLIELNLSRQVVLENYFTQIAPTLEPELLRDRINILQAIEQQILQYSQSLRDDTAKKLKDLHRGKRVEQAYSAHAAA